MPVPQWIHSTAPFIAAGLCCLPLSAAHAANHPKTKLTLTDARTIAVAKESGAVKSGELEHEKGRWIYSFDIQHAAQTREVNVDANTGEVVEDSLDTAVDEAREQAAETRRPRSAPHRL